MVVLDVGDDRHAGVEDVGGVQPAADAHLDQREVDVAPASSAKAAAVSASNSVGGPSCPATRSIAGSTARNAAANRASCSGRPSIAIRSR